MRITSIVQFKAALRAAGAEILAPTNPYEVLRFRSSKGVGVIYKGKRGETWNREACAARAHLEGGRGSLSPVPTTARRKQRHQVASIMERDGDACFFCGWKLGDDATIEHLVAISHGGPNHISNLFLAHAVCNQRAGHLSAPEKIALAIAERSKL